MKKKQPSSCLKEVEKIKQKREERRAAQQALREQQDLEYDTTAPNWEFGAMIRFEKCLYYVFTKCPFYCSSSSSPVVWSSG